MSEDRPSVWSVFADCTSSRQASGSEADYRRKAAEARESAAKVQSSMDSVADQAARRAKQEEDSHRGKVQEARAEAAKLQSSMESVSDLAARRQSVEERIHREKKKEAREDAAKVQSSMESVADQAARQATEDEAKHRRKVEESRLAAAKVQSSMDSVTDQAIRQATEEEAIHRKKTEESRQAAAKVQSAMESVADQAARQVQNDEQVHREKVEEARKEAAKAQSSMETVSDLAARRQSVEERIHREKAKKAREDAAKVQSSMDSVADQAARQVTEDELEHRTKAEESRKAAAKVQSSMEVLDNNTDAKPIANDETEGESQTITDAMDNTPVDKTLVPEEPGHEESVADVEAENAAPQDDADPSVAEVGSQEEASSGAIERKSENFEKDSSVKEEIASVQERGGNEGDTEAVSIVSSMSDEPSVGEKVPVENTAEDKGTEETLAPKNEAIAEGKPSEKAAAVDEAPAAPDKRRTSVSDMAMKVEVDDFKNFMDGDAFKESGASIDLKEDEVLVGGGEVSTNE